MNLPMAPIAGDSRPLSRGHPRAAGGGARAGRGARRRHPRPQLPGARGAGRRRLRRRLARPLAARRAAADADVIAFCGVHFMAETASILSPEKTVLIPDLDAGCSLADSITPERAARLAGQVPRRDDRHVRQHDGRDQGDDRLLLHVVQRRHGRRAHPRASTGRTRRSCSGRTCGSAPTSRRRLGRALHVWDGECHVHAGIRPADITDVRAEHPDADFLIHPECGCSRRSWSTSPPATSTPRACTCSRPAGCSSYAEEHARPRRHGDRGDRDRDAVPAAHGRAGRGLHRRQRGGDVPLHEDDHAAEAARRAARPHGEVKVPGGHRRSARAMPIERMVAIERVTTTGRAGGARPGLGKGARSLAETRRSRGRLLSAARGERPSMPLPPNGGAQIHPTKEESRLRWTP